MDADIICKSDEWVGKWGFMMIEIDDCKDQASRLRERQVARSGTYGKKAIMPIIFTSVCLSVCLSICPVRNLMLHVYSILHTYVPCLRFSPKSYQIQERKPSGSLPGESTTSKKNLVLVLVLYHSYGN